MSKALSCLPGQNSLIATVSPADRALLEARLSVVKLSRGFVLEKPGIAIGTIYFPVAGIASMVAIGRNGRRIEAGLFGRDGMSGLAVLLGGDTSPNETFMQMGGHGWSVSAAALRELLDQSATLRRHLLLFSHTLLIQVCHTALSNGQSRLEARLARWLLMCHDRSEGNELKLTHEFLSVMLGVRRAGVTVGTHVLEGKGLIRAQRGKITILDREGLEAEAGQAYGVPEGEYHRLLGREVRQSV